MNLSDKNIYIPKYINKKISTNLFLYIPTIYSSKNNAHIIDYNTKTTFYAKSLFDNYWCEHINYDPSYYPHFTFVMNRDGSIWYEANLYLVNLIQNDTAYNEDQRITQSTISDHATSLQKYKLFCDEQDDELDYIQGRNKDERESNPFWKIARRPFSRPNFKYRDYLQARVNKNEISPNYAKKLLYPITSFYYFINEYFGKDYLILGKGIEMPGKESKSLIIVDKNKSLIVNTNESNKIRGSTNKHLGYINDGGNTKPLTETEQLEILDILYNQGQSEIIISFLFSLTTAARMDTTFTLRLCYFVNNLPEDYSQYELSKWRSTQTKFNADEIYSILVGEGTLIDAKGLEKRYYLKIPGWMMEIIRTYIISERAVKRRMKIKFPQDNPLEEYVFITQNFNPYYIAKSDLNKGKYENMNNGGAIRVFITENITKQIKFKFKFHYLRATCLMNIYTKMQLNNQLTDTQKIDALRIFAGHKSEKTTKQYLDYSKNEEFRYEAYDYRGDKLLNWLKSFNFFNSNEYSNEMSSSNNE
ncbi:hypothetical protein ACOL3B_06625 [Aliarcobacter butzleri]